MAPAFGASGSGTFVRTSIFVIAVLAFAGTGMATHAVGCLKPDIDQAADGTAVARQALLAVPVGDEATETDVTSARAADIARMKDALAALADAFMRCARPDLAPQQAERQLNALLKGPAPSKNQESDYGYSVDFHVVRPPDEPDMIAIEPSFQIACGGDTMLLLYERRSGIWSDVLRWQSGPYKTVGGAFDFFDFAVSPPDQKGNWYVLAKTIAPWCTSTWSEISYAVLRPQSGTAKPKVVLQADAPIWWGSEDFGQLTAAKDWFDVRFHAQSIDTGVHNRLWIRHFAIDGNTVRRMQPVAESPRDFADEWIVSSWGEASGWTTLAARASLRKVHDHLNYYRENIGSFQYESIPYLRWPG